MKIFTTIIIIKANHPNPRIIKKEFNFRKKDGRETIF